jgi:predicted nucleic acid-binding protein
MRRVVDASPAIFLAKIDALELLQLGAEEVLMPSIVFWEIEQVDDSALVAVFEAKGKWLIECEYRAEQPIDSTSLGIGERAVIEQAVGLGIEQVVMDDLAARCVAEQVGLKPIGTLGILLAAKLAGVIPSVSEKIEALQASGMYLSESLIQRLLIEAGEREAP